jgi:rRNA maturation endonuclease Nob1
MTMPSVGDVVTLALTWGTQRRLKCPACKRYIHDADETACLSCGRAYSRVDGDDYRMVGFVGGEHVAH